MQTMLRHTIIALVLLVGPAVQARPNWNKLQKTSGDIVPGRYIVVLKPEFEPAAFLDKVKGTAPSVWANSTVLAIYKNVLKGFSAKLTQEALQEYLDHEEVAYVEEDSVVRALQADVPGSWGLDRVDQRFLPLDGQAEFTGDGSGVTAYILDTGIYPSNIYFGGRAIAGFDAVGGSQEGIDCNGHGTHCSGTIGANTYGIATGATLVGVRVLNCFGSGSVSQIITGLDWVAENAVKPAVASMSLGGSVSLSLDQGVTSLIRSGVLVSVAAGNNDGDACDNSPARARGAITVGATDRDDSRAYFSNYGTCVDIFAPGVDITSTWYTGPTATNTISGTSMSCPHVTGAAVITLGNDGSLSPAQTKARLIDDATPDVVRDPQVGSPNLLLYIP